MIVLPCDGQKFIIDDAEEKGREFVDKKFLLIIKVDTEKMSPKDSESLRIRVRDEMQEGVVVIDKSHDVEVVTYDVQNVDVKVVKKDEKMVVVKK